MPQSLSRVLIHLIFSTKNRVRIIAPSIQPKLHSYLGGTLNHLDCHSLQVGGVEDHVHLFFGQSRTRTIAEVVEAVKTNSSKWMKTHGKDPLPLLPPVTKNASLATCQILTRLSFLDCAAHSIRSTASSISDGCWIRSAFMPRENCRKPGKPPEAPRPKQASTAAVAASSTSTTPRSKQKPSKFAATKKCSR